MLKVMSIIPILFFRKFELLLPGRNENVQVAELFLQNMFCGNPNRTETKVVVVVFGLLEVTVFNILFGTFIYRDFYDESIYIFTRYKSRWQWHKDKLIQLGGYCALYTALMVMIVFCLCLNCSAFRVDREAVRVLFLSFILLFLFSYWNTLVINYLSVCLGATKSFVFDYLTLLVLSMLAVNYEKLPVVGQFTWGLKLNPVANVVLNWQENFQADIFPMGYFVVLIMITVLCGTKIIRECDIGLENKEQRG